jgi:hypothetical protein
MAITYFRVSFFEQSANLSPQLKTTLHSTPTAVDPNEIKREIKKVVLKNPSALVTITKIDKIDKKAFLAEGGNKPL